MQDKQFYLTFGQVYKITIFNSIADLCNFTDYIHEQVKENNDLKSENWDIKTQISSSRRKIIESILDKSTNYNELINQYEKLNLDNKKPKKINTTPILIVELYDKNSIGSIIPKKVICESLSNSITEIPKIGQWVSVLGCSIYNIDKDIPYDGIKYFYFPFSINKKKFSNLSSINKPKDITSGKISNKTAKNILWPRSGSTIIQNQNGKSNIIIDEDNVLLSTGFKDLPFGLAGDKIDDMNIHEFFRKNPPDTSDSFIFIDKYDIDWETQLNDYRKKLYEISRLDDTSIIDNIIEEISNIKSFNDRIKLFFGIDFSNVYEWKYSSAPNISSENKTKDSAILIHGKNIFLSNTFGKKTKFNIARSQPTEDIIYGLIDIVKDLITAINSHMPLGTPPGTPISPMPDFILKTQEAATKLQKIQGELSEISSKKVYIE